MIKIITVLGARPQFIKAAAVSTKLRSVFNEIFVHTGQHYDTSMSDIFFEELNIPKPEYQFSIGSSSHGAQTGEMLKSIEQVLVKEKPDYVMVYGDTNSTLAGALAASKLLIPVIHVEAGLRSFNKAMPEEQNRILTDHVSELLFVPTQTAVENLNREGIQKNIHLVGDVMYDGILHFSKIAAEKSTILADLELEKEQFILCTIHRAENTNNIERLKSIFKALSNLKQKIVLPLHPRTKKYMQEYGISLAENIQLLDPLGYLDMIRLESRAAKIMSDSGGVQKEAFFLGKPCITLRDETEWVETIENGWNVLVGADATKIQNAVLNFKPTTQRSNYFGDGSAVEQMIKLIASHHKQ